MDLNLKGKVVLITGGSKGIGLACASSFMAEGATVAIASRNEANLADGAARLKDYGDVYTISADLVKHENALKMAKEVEDKLGPIDVLVNSAGAARRYALEDLSAAAWHDAMDAKYFTYIHAMDAVLPGMAARKKGSIVNIIGIGGKVPTPVHLPGGAANAALMLATTGLAYVYGGKGIRINGINPGATLTERVEEALQVEAAAKGISQAEVNAAQQARTPMGRYAKSGEVAAVALFLASDQASYLTGALIPMDGCRSPVI